MKILKKVVVANENGLNVKVSIVLSNLTKQFDCDLEITDGTRTVNPKSLLGLLTLASPKGTELKVMAEGSGAETALLAISNLFKEKFGEEE